MTEFYNEKSLQHESEPFEFPDSKAPQEAKSWDYLMFVQETFGKAIVTREMKLFSHRADDGDT